MALMQSSNLTRQQGPARFNVGRLWLAGFNICVLNCFMVIQFAPCRALPRQACRLPTTSDRSYANNASKANYSTIYINQIRLTRQPQGCGSPIPMMLVFKNKNKAGPGCQKVGKPKGLKEVDQGSYASCFFETESCCSKTQ